MMWISLGLSFLMAYFIGSISSAILVGKIMAGDDIRHHGSGNAGATNALRTYGKKAAVFVVVGDCLKAVVAILLAKLLAGDSNDADLAVYAAGLGAVLGHNFPVYFHFRGGKGIIVSTVCMLFADWQLALAVIAFSLLIMIVFRYVSLGSILGAFAFAVVGSLWHWGDIAFVVFAILLGGLAILMHRSNIKRLLQGTENRLGKKKAV